VLGLLQALCATVLAVTLYAITCDQDSDLAMLTLLLRVGEGLLGAISTRATRELLWLARRTKGAGMLRHGRRLARTSQWAGLEYECNLVRHG
jgi:hypothetical protein